MKLVSYAIRSTGALSCRTRLPWTVRSIFTGKNFGGDNMVDNLSESVDDFERRVFRGDLDGNSKNDLFIDKFDRMLANGRGRPTLGSRDIGGASGLFNEVPGGSFNTLSDGVYEKLKKAATVFATSDEINEDDYSFRPDVKFRPGMTYTLRDLDLTKPAAQKPFRRPEFKTTTEEVLRKADFRNVRFLSNFITEAGLIIKRSKTLISAKAQRKVAREIKTARAFGLLPFTTMGTKQFQFGKSMEDLDEDMEFENLYNQPITYYYEDKNNDSRKVPF